jgi:predicted nucleic acid-binding protein
VARVIVLDTSVLIAYLDGEDEHHAAAEALLTQAIDDDLAANSLTLAEVLVVPVRDGRLDPVQAALRDLELQELPFPVDTAVRLAQLRATTGLRMPDCCVLLAAEDAAASVASFDERLAQAAEDRNLAALRR